MADSTSARAALVELAVTVSLLAVGWRCDGAAHGLRAWRLFLGVLALSLLFEMVDVAALETARGQDLRAILTWFMQERRVR